MAPSRKRKIHKHRCLWLYRPKKRGTEYMKADRKAWPRAVLFCWQTGKRIRTRECTPCLLARLITVKSNMVNSLGHKRPETTAEWERRHGEG